MFAFIRMLSITRVTFNKYKLINIIFVVWITMCRKSAFFIYRGILLYMTDENGQSIGKISGRRPFSPKVLSHRLSLVFHSDVGVKKLQQVFPQISQWDSLHV